MRRAFPALAGILLGALGCNRAPAPFTPVALSGPRSGTWVAEPNDGSEACTLPCALWVPPDEGYVLHVFNFEEPAREVTIPRGHFGGDGEPRHVTVTDEPNWNLLLGAGLGGLGGAILGGLVLAAGGQSDCTGGGGSAPDFSVFCPLGAVLLGAGVVTMSIGIGVGSRKVVNYDVRRTPQ